MRRLLLTALLGWVAGVAAAERVASFSPGATRTLVDFGATDKIVAATRWCPLPAAHPAARDCDVFNPDLERLLRAHPDLVILPRTSNPLWAERCRGAGLKVLVLNPEGADSVLADTRLIGEALGRPTEVIDQLNRPLEGIPAQRPRKLLIVWDGMMAGPDSYLGVVMRSAGFKSALAKGSWVKLDWETVAQADPEAMLWVDSLPTDGPVVFAQKRQAEMSQVSVIKGLKVMDAGLIFRTSSGSQWLPGSGLAQLIPKLRELRDKLR
jgi:ABC-type Fe3+-hydroxamate transport system substrate-binding protein